MLYKYVRGWTINWTVLGNLRRTVENVVCLFDRTSLVDSYFYG